MFRFAQGTKVSLADVVDDANLMTVPKPASNLKLIHFKLVKWIKVATERKAAHPLVLLRGHEGAQDPPEQLLVLLLSARQPVQSILDPHLRQTHSNTAVLENVLKSNFKNGYEYNF